MHKGVILSSVSTVGQRQPTVIILTNMVVLECQMLHTKFQGHRSYGSRDEDF